MRIAGECRSVTGLEQQSVWRAAHSDTQTEADIELLNVGAWSCVMHEW